MKMRDQFMNIRFHHIFHDRDLELEDYILGEEERCKEELKHNILKHI